MARSLKKGPYVCPRLFSKVEKMLATGDKKAVKTWARRSDIHPLFVGITFSVHNGKQFLPVYVSEEMVGHKLGEFSMTRKFKGHGGKKK